VRIFNLYLFTRKNKEKDEYIIDKSIKRIIIKNNLIQALKQNNIDILIYQFYIAKEIVELNKLNKTKTIFINRSCFLHWIYYELYYFFKTVYKAYKKSRYVISLIPFENDYLFKRWGINSILMNNFIPYEPNHVKPSDLSSKTILMIGRGDDPIKRFELGIYTMKYIVMEIPDCEMKIICNTDTIHNLNNLAFKLNLNNCIKFIGYTPNPDNFYKNASMHLFMTKAEAFPNILSETLSYGIPNILAGLDYVSTAKGGTVIIYDDSPISIASIAINHYIYL
jgi:glycosyltransferase involved in cell wall biosynthesis